MKIFAKVLMLTAGLVFWAMPSSAQTYRITVIGDSLVAGTNISPDDTFSVQLQDVLNEDGYNVLVTDSGRVFETTESVLPRIGKDIADMPDIIILALGMMDGIRGIPLEDTERNLSRALAVMQKNEIAVLLVGIHAPPIQDKKYPQELNALYKALARKYRVLLYPNFTANIIDYTTGEQKIYLVGDDELHPNADGVAVQVEGILPYVKEILNSLDIKYQTTTPVASEETR